MEKTRKNAVTQLKSSVPRSSITADGVMVLTTNQLKACKATPRQMVQTAARFGPSRRSRQRTLLDEPDTVSPNHDPDFAPGVVADSIASFSSFAGVAARIKDSASNRTLNRIHESCCSPKRTSPIARRSAM